MGDVGLEARTWRARSGPPAGTVQNLASAFGTALIRFVLVTLLSTGSTKAISRNEFLTPELQSPVDGSATARPDREAD